jgi:septal ring factor EnvC (AmiA/AmiB activator)
MKIFDLNFKTIITTIVILLVSILPINTLMAQSLQEQLDAVQKELALLRKEKEDIQNKINSNNYVIAGYNSQLSKLYGEAEILKKEIESITLQIKELEITIKQLNNEIEKKQKDIEQRQNEIALLENDSNQRLKDTYKNFRLNRNYQTSGSNLVFSGNINKYFKTSQYIDILQSDTNLVLNDLTLKKAQLEVKKSELEELLIQVQKDKALVDIKAADIKSKQAEVDAKVSVYYREVSKLNSVNNDTKNTLAVFSKKEQEQAAKVLLLQQQILDQFSSIPSGEYVLAGTMIGRQGSTGWSTGPHLHFSLRLDGSLVNPCSYLEAGAMGCGAGGNLKSPLKGEYYFTSGYGNRCFWWNGSQTCHFHDGIDVAAVPWNAAVYAAHDGYVFKGVDIYGANYVVLCQNSNCNQGYKSGYWHLSAF